jgi:hypothetical protein
VSVSACDALSPLLLPLLLRPGSRVVIRLMASRWFESVN